MRDRRFHQSHRNCRKGPGVAAVQGVVPRRLEFRQKVRELNDLRNLGVQLGSESVEGILHADNMPPQCPPAILICGQQVVSGEMAIERRDNAEKS